MIKKINPTTMPDFLTLFKAIFLPLKMFPVAIKYWVREGDTPFFLKKSSCSLAAIAILRQKIEGRKKISFWVPDFFCNSSLLELRETGVNIIFYPIREDLTPDLGSCKENLDRRADIFLLVHYFGRPVSTLAARSFCLRNNAWLVEDATHVLKAQEGVGLSGDFIFYSPHKHLPMPNGSILIARSLGPSSLNISQSFKDELQKIIASKDTLSLKDVKFTFFWTSKRVLQKLGVRVFNPTAFNIDAICDDRAGSFQIGWLSKKLLPYLCSRLEEVHVKRKINSKIWRELLQRSRFNLKLESPSGFHCSPYMEKVAFEDELEAHKFYDALQAAIIPVVTWPDLPPEVLKHREDHLAAINMRYRQVFFPVHQDIGEREFLFCSLKLFSLAVRGWTVLSITEDEWDYYWPMVKGANLVQSAAYGKSKGISSAWNPQFFLIADANKVPVAIFQALVVSVPLMGYIAFINQGPLILNGTDTDNDNYSLFLSITALSSVKKIYAWRALFVAPNILQSHESTLILKGMGYKKIWALPPWESAKLLLSPDVDQLMNGLTVSWRGALRKGFKLGITIIPQEINPFLKLWVQDAYAKFQSDKGFIGLPSLLLKNLLEQPKNGDLWGLRVYTAHQAQDSGLETSIGTLITIESGDTATYLLSMTNDIGRQLQANYVLLWRAILDAKNNKLTYFDVGGLGGKTPKGIAGFKKGLNAIAYTLSGTWLRI